tara:strand:+ start:205 stop:345 length:141 start_codon:yes stop_codon:yes gene_type:complete
MIFSTTQKASQVMGGVDILTNGIDNPNHRNSIYSRCTVDNDFKRKE